MSKTRDSSVPAYAVGTAPKTKTLDLHLPGTSDDLESKIRDAFALAKSSGLELNLALSFEDASSSMLTWISHQRNPGY